MEVLFQIERLAPKKKKKLQKSVPALATFIKSSEFPVPARLKEQNHPKNAFPKEFPYSRGEKSSKNQE